MQFLRKLFRREGEGARGPGEKQEADPGALDVSGDPRGGWQDEEYVTADPREVVESEGTVMSGPGGAPMEDASPAERRERDQSQPP